MKKIIALCGLIGSGKDTCASYLVDNGFRKESFATPLKDAVASIFGWDRGMLEGDTAESRAWREELDPVWTSMLGQPITPRKMLQVFGTEVVRNGFHDKTWVYSLIARISKAPANYVISDCRFPNELESLRSIGAVCVRVTRGELPSWWTSAVAACGGDTAAQLELHLAGIHPSEWSLAGSKFDLEIDNSGSLINLYSQCDTLR